ncbi:MAG: hypothetical protein NC434_11015 [Ruminococcus sp.]|nr:hypothetical protein [Ruminococcus sp.]
MKYTNGMKINGEKLYSYTGCLGDSEGITFEELQADFESLADELGENE